MAYSSDRFSVVKLDASPSMLYNNLSTSSTHLVRTQRDPCGPLLLATGGSMGHVRFTLFAVLQAFVHKDAVYIMDLRALDCRVPAKLEPVTSAEFITGLTRVHQRRRGSGPAHCLHVCLCHHLCISSRRALCSAGRVLHARR